MTRSWMVLPLLLGLCAPALAQETQTRDDSATPGLCLPQCDVGANHLILFKASLEWLDKATVDGQTNTMLKLGY